ncbi:MAG: hypothetical protein LBV11_07020 [Bacillus cereus]|jgi:hypothetical protein|nr:hypothetical protein [Bacillus cereus]
MKNRSNNFKFKITPMSNGTVIGVSYSNRQIHGRLFKLLNDKAHEAIQEFNGHLDWRETFIEFEHKGKKYRQIKANDQTLCEGCCFNGIVLDCIHPFFYTKGNCRGRIYIEEK